MHARLPSEPRPGLALRRSALVAAVMLALVPFAGCRPRVAQEGRRIEKGPVERPKGAVGPDAAARYVLALVNRDRGDEGLYAVDWDETAARAALAHAEDMARNGYTGHWEPNGSVPEERYTDAGGQHLVWENAFCVGDGIRRELDPNPTFTAEELEAVEHAFISEVPPNDGHRQNILKEWHVKLGVGVTKTKRRTTPEGAIELPATCLAQEFVDEFGEYGPLPRQAGRGESVTVRGEVHAPMKFGAVGVAKLEPAAPIPVAELLARGGYDMPQAYVMYLPPGFVTPKPVTVKGNEFSVDVPIGEKGPGRYAVSVWAHFPGARDSSMSMVSLRVVRVP